MRRSGDDPLDELWSPYLERRDDLKVFIALLREFDMLCDVRPSTGDPLESIVPCLLPDKVIPVSELACEGDFEVIELFVCFPHNVLPTGLFHQLAVRFVSNGPVGFDPIVYHRGALVSLDHAQLILEEDYPSGSIRIKLCVRTAKKRSDFTRSWRMISAIVDGVITDHWSKSAGYMLVPACPSSEVPHGLTQFPKYGGPTPEHVIYCKHSSHDPSRYRVDITSIKHFWFSDSSESVASTWEGISDGSAEDGHGTIMMSYSWGDEDEVTGSFPDQEVVKKLAEQLEKHSFTIWMDVKYMKGHMTDKMRKVIENCLAVVACVTNHYHTVGSNAEKEFLYACRKKKPIFGVKLTPDADMSSGSYGFERGTTYKFYDFSSGKSHVVNELVRDLKMVIDSI